MTNEKAKEILKLYKKKLEESVSTELGNDIQAFEMAISALKNNDNSAENNDKMQDSEIKVDLISREYALKQIEIAEEKGVDFTFETLKDFIKILPTYSAKEDTTGKEYKAEVITRGNCMICGKELIEGLFLCKECRDKAESEEEE